MDDLFDFFVEVNNLVNLRCGGFKSVEIVSTRWSAIHHSELDQQRNANVNSPVLNDREI